jgi:hypothetical protein
MGRFGVAIRAGEIPRSRSAGQEQLGVAAMDPSEGKGKGTEGCDPSVE